MRMSAENSVALTSKSPRVITALRGSPKKPKPDSICLPGSKTIPNCAAFSTPRKSLRGFLPYEYSPHVRHCSRLVRLHRGRGSFSLPRGNAFGLLHLPAVPPLHRRKARQAQPKFRSEARRTGPRLRPPLSAEWQGLPRFCTESLRGNWQG